MAFRFYTETSSLEGLRATHGVALSEDNIPAGAYSVEFATLTEARAEAVEAWKYDQARAQKNGIEYVYLTLDTVPR